MKVDIYVEDSYDDSANVYVPCDNPDNVRLSVDTDLMLFTPDQARELAEALIKAAEACE